MQAVAAWLVARPLNAVLALVATSALPYLGFLSSVVLVLLVIHQGIRTAVFEAMLAAALLSLAGLIGGTSVAVLAVATLVNWSPALVLAAALRMTRSLTLTLQLSVLIAVLAIAAFVLVVGDPAEFWRRLLTTIAEVWREVGLNDEADLVERELGLFAAQMTMVAVLSLWTVYAVSFVMGYLLYRQLPGETADYGRFRDLNLGRVIALIMALTSVLALLSGAAWLQNIAFVTFAVFWLQGLAIVHWLHGEARLPAFAVIVVYVLLPLLNVILMLALALLGYADSWFRYRREQAATP